MRMWNLPPQILCRQHFLGEHNELHKLVGALNHNRNLTTYIKRGYVEIHNIRRRHEELEADFPRRNYHHNSPLPQFHEFKAGKIDPLWNLYDLLTRCSKCRELFVTMYHQIPLYQSNLLIPNRSTVMPKRKHKKQKPSNVGEGLLSIASGNFLRPDKKKAGDESGG